METNEIFERVGFLDAARNDKLVSEFVNPNIILPKSDTYKIVIDARLFNAKTDISHYDFPLLPVQLLIPTIDGTTFSTTHFSTAFHQVALTPETRKLVHFVVGNEQYEQKPKFH